MKTYQKMFEFGKVAYEGKNKVNRVRLDVELRIQHGRPVFSVSAEVWQANMNDIVMGGQCLEEIWKDFEGQLENRAKFYAILTLWRKFHLNDMHAGCEHQDRRGETWETSPGAVCPECGWKLGHGWSYRAIPEAYLGDILTLLAVPLADQIEIMHNEKEQAHD